MSVYMHIVYYAHWSINIYVYRCIYYVGCNEYAYIACVRSKLLLSFKIRNGSVQLFLFFWTKLIYQYILFQYFS